MLMFTENDHRIQATPTTGLVKAQRATRSLAKWHRKNTERTRRCVRCGTENLRYYFGRMQLSDPDSEGEYEEMREDVEGYDVSGGLVTTSSTTTVGARSASQRTNKI